MEKVFGWCKNKRRYLSAKEKITDSIRGHLLNPGVSNDTVYGGLR